MTTQTLPYEILLRFKDGNLSGAHYVEVVRYLDDAGEIITEKMGQAQPIPTALSESILGAVNTASLARIAELEAELQAAREGPQPESSTLAAETITKLHALFSTTLPPEAQAAFAMPYAIVRVLVEAEQYALAAAVIQGIAVPPELEEAKVRLLAILPL